MTRSEQGGEIADPDEECRHGLTEATCSLCKLRPPRLAPPRRPTKSPHSAEDLIAALSGSKDVSVPVHAVEPYLGTRTDWLTAHGYPHDLRPRGWIYLRCDESLAARVRAVGVRWKDDRPVRTGEDPRGEGFGPGLVFEVDPGTWEQFDQALGEAAQRMRQGYRYHLTDRAGVAHHLIAGDRVPEGDWETDA